MRACAHKVYIVIPTYNEAENLPRLVEALEEELEKRGFKIILVDDSSPDGTVKIVKRLNHRYGNILFHCRPSKLGIGSAIRDGLKIALSFTDCEYIVTMDADLSHNPKDIRRLLSEAGNADLVQGSRYVKGGRVVGWSFFRSAVSYVANLLCRLLFKTQLHEHTSNFRVYSRRCSEMITATLHCEHYEWLIGSILIAKDHSYRIKEVPITFTERKRGKSKLKPVDILKWANYVSKMFFKRSVYGA